MSAEAIPEPRHGRSVQEWAGILAVVGAGAGAMWFFSGGFCLACLGSGRAIFSLKKYGSIDGGPCPVCGGDGRILA